MQKIIQTLKSVLHYFETGDLVPFLVVVSIAHFVSCAVCAAGSTGAAVGVLLAFSGRAAFVPRARLVLHFS